MLGCRAETKAKLRDNREALAYFDAAIDMGPTYYFLYSGRAKLRFELEDYAGAIADCDKALPMLCLEILEFTTAIIAVKSCLG